jgi:hypothetical protein
LQSTHRENAIRRAENDNGFGGKSHQNDFSINKMFGTKNKGASEWSLFDNSGGTENLLSTLYKQEEKQDEKLVDETKLSKNGEKEEKKIDEKEDDEESDEDERVKKSLPEYPTYPLEHRRRHLQTLSTMRPTFAPSRTLTKVPTINPTIIPTNIAGIQISNEAATAHYENITIYNNILNKVNTLKVVELEKMFLGM